MRRKRKSNNNTFHPSKALSPLRYPGGKSWLIPNVEKWLTAIKATRRHRLVEPFAGGANVGLAMLARGKVGALTIVELDKRIAAFWKLVLRDPEWLIRAIRNFTPTRKNLAERLGRNARRFRELGFQTLLKNRTSRGGVIAPRAGILKHGERKRGPFSRWYPDTLIKRVKRISELEDKIKLVHGDGLRILRERKKRTNDVYFVDPPYSFSSNGAGRRLYSHYEVPHEDLIKAVKKLRGPFLMTYDNDAAIHALAKKHKLSTSKIQMRSSHHANKKELLISSDLSGIRRKRGHSARARRKSTH